MQCLQIPYPHLAYHTLKFVFQRKELVIFDLISFWEQNEPNWSAIFLLCQMKLSRATVIMSLQVCLIPKKCLRGIFFSCRKAELQRTLCPCSKVESAVLSWSWQIYLTCLKKKKLALRTFTLELTQDVFPSEKTLGNFAWCLPQIIFGTAETHCFPSSLSWIWRKDCSFPFWSNHLIVD